MKLGTHTITMSYPGDANNYPVQKTWTETVTSAPVTFSFTSMTQNYTGGPITPPVTR